MPWAQMASHSYFPLCYASDQYWCSPYFTWLWSLYQTNIFILDVYDGWNYPLKPPLHFARYLIINSFSLIVEFSMQFPFKSRPHACPNVVIFLAKTCDLPGNPISSAPFHCALMHPDKLYPCIFRRFYVMQFSVTFSINQSLFSNLRSVQSYIRLLITCLIGVYCNQHLALLLLYGSSLHFARASEHASRKARSIVNIISKTWNKGIIIHTIPYYEDNQHANVNKLQRGSHILKMNATFTIDKQARGSSSA